MVTRIIMSTIIGAAIYFFFGMFSWMHLPFHQESIGHFKDEAVVINALKTAAPVSGIYVSPKIEAKQDTNGAAAETAKAGQPDQAQPFVFVSIKHEGQDPTMRSQIICAALMSLVGAFLVTLLLLYAARTAYLCRVSFVLILGLTIGVLGVIPSHIWWGFSLPYTIANIVDYVAGWGLAGLVMAAIIKREKAA